MIKHKKYSIWDNPPLHEKEPDLIKDNGSKWDWDYVFNKMKKRRY